MKNHYIPQLIINRFSTAVNVFNLDTTEIRVKRPSNKIFFTKNIYTDEVELSLSRNLEQPFGVLLKEKLLKEKKIEINRKDLMLIKKYMFITSIRSQDLDHFCSLLIDLGRKTDLYFRHVRAEFPEIPNYLLSTTEMLKSMSKYDFFNQQLLALSEFSYDEIFNPYVLFFDKRLSLEMACLATSFYFAYIAFWDAPNSSEFVLSDAGIISEYEGFHQITGGLDVSKSSYIFHQYKVTEPRRCGAMYGKVLQTSLMMYENYDLFNISSNRCIVSINPFLKLYDPKQEYMVKDDDGKIVRFKASKPDIWPAVIQNKQLFETPSAKYVSPGKYLVDDKFIYLPKRLSKKEMIYINSLFINESRLWIGFNDPHKVYDSFEYCLEHESQYHSVTKPHESKMSVAVNYVNNLINSRFNKILEWCVEQGCTPSENVVELFQALTNDIYKDFNSNVYIYEYYLDHYQETYDNVILDFLGDGDKKKKMEFFENGYKRLSQEKGK